jgi:PleD family two-component response regulator
MANHKDVERSFYQTVLQEQIDSEAQTLREMFEKKSTDLNSQIQALKEVKEKLWREKPVILVVDDEPHIVNLIKLSLQDDFEVITANSGNEALIKAKNEQPDLITMDIMMPGMSGFEVVDELKKWEDTKEIPVIFLSAKDKLKDMYSGMKLGAEDYITKPFEPEELNKRVKQNLENNKRGEL